MAKKMTTEDVIWANIVVGVQQSHARDVLALAPQARVLVHRLQDPAFRPVATWPQWSADVVMAAECIVNRIEAEGAFA